MKKTGFLLKVLLALVILVSAGPYMPRYMTWTGGRSPGAEKPFRVAPTLLSGTGGQPDAGTLSGGNFTLTGGFLAVETQSFLIPAADHSGITFLITRRGGLYFAILWPIPGDDGGIRTEQGGWAKNSRQDAGRQGSITEQKTQPR